MAKNDAQDLAIYVVSGQASTRLNIKRYLQQQKHQVFTASSGKELIELDKDFLGNLIIADTFLPDMPVNEMLFEIRENRRLMKDIADIDFIPSVVVAGANERLDDKEMKKLGCIGRMQKPLNLKIMGTFLAKIISGEIKLIKDDRVGLGIMDPEKRATQYLAKLLQADDLRIHCMHDNFDLRAAMNGDTPLDILIVETLALSEDPQEFITHILGKKSDAKIIVVTAYADDEEIEELKGYGVHEVMTKPIKPMVIRKMIRELVAEKMR